MLKIQCKNEMTLQFSNFLLWRIIILFVFTEYIQAGIHQKRLLEHLFKEYDYLERPVEFENDSLVVHTGLAVQQIVDVDEKKQVITFSGWLDMRWKDYNLAWDPEEFGNISVIRIPSHRIWVPDLLLYNSADDTFDSTSKVNAVIESSGYVTYIPPGMFRSTCSIKVEDFPFDDQICELKFGSWTHDESSVLITNKSDQGQIDAYIKNGEWLLKGVRSYSESISYDCCPEKYPFVMFEIHLRRRSLYFIFNLILPCILISLMSLLGFVLPPDSGEKVGLEVAVLLSIIMFSQIINETIPESSLSVSKIGIYFSSVMLLSSCSIVANIFVLVLHHRNVKIQNPMPRWIEVYVCHYLGRAMGMEYPTKLKRKSSLRKLEFPYDERPGKNSINDFIMIPHNSIENLNCNNPNNIGNKRPSQLYKAKPKSNLSNQEQLTNFSQQQTFNSFKLIKRDVSNLSDIYGYERKKDHKMKTDEYYIKRNLTYISKELHYITKKMRLDDIDEIKSLKWKYAAMVVDRFFCLLFAITTIFSTSIILFTCKNFFADSNPSERF